MNSRWHIAGEAAAAILLGATLWSYAMMTPALDWNAARLFPAMLMAAGRSPYFPVMSGPATGWIYGPIMPMLHLPASLAPTITSAMVVSACINAAAFVLPILAVADYAAWRCGFRRERLAIAVTCLGLLLAQPGLNNYLLWIQSDQVAIGLALLSCVFLARENLVGAAALAVLAVWTKQIAIAVPLAHAVYLIALRREPTDALRYIAWFAVIGIAVSAVMVRLFGLEPLVYNLWIVPSGNHLKDWQTVWIANTLELLKEGSPSLIVAAACWRVAGDFHRWPNLNSIVKVLLTLAVCQLPFGLLAAAKIGGGNNSFHLVGTLYTVAIVCAVGAAATRRETLRRRHFTWTSVAAALLGAAITSAVIPVRLTPDPHLEAARILATGHPEQIYFPGNPLVTWWTEKKAYHLEYGLMDQWVAGYPVSRRRYWEYLPADLRLLVYSLGHEDSLVPLLFKIKSRLQVDSYVILVVAK